MLNFQLNLGYSEKQNMIFLNTVFIFFYQILWPPMQDIKKKKSHWRLTEKIKEKIREKNNKELELGRQVCAEPTRLGPSLERGRGPGSSQCDTTAHYKANWHSTVWLSTDKRADRKTGCLMWNAPALTRGGWDTLMLCISHLRSEHTCALFLF